MAPRKPKRAGSPSKATGRASKRAATNKKHELEEDPRKTFLRALGAPTSHRKHKSEYMLSMSSLHDNSIDESHIEELAQNLGISSFEAWGKTAAKPITATVRKVRPLNRQIRAPGSAQASFSTLFPTHNATRTPEPIIPIIPNNPTRSALLLGIPLEIRERIYSYFLQYPSPILLKPNLFTIESLPAPPIKTKHPLALLHICRQITHETTSYIYRTNTFSAIFRSAPKPRDFRLQDNDEDFPSSSIPSHFIKLYRNVILDLPKENWGSRWYERAAECVEKLVQAGGVLGCLTVVCAPMRVGMTEMAMGMVEEGVTFSDFLWGEGRVMGGVMALGRRGCKGLNVVVRLNGRRLLITVDLSGLGVGAVGVEGEGEGEGGGLRNEESVKVLEMRKKAVEEELNCLKERFELVFEDEERALSGGLCRVLGPEESLMDGVKLAERK